MFITLKTLIFFLLSEDSPYQFFFIYLFIYLFIYFPYQFLELGNCLDWEWRQKKKKNTIFEDLNIYYCDILKQNFKQSHISLRSL